MRNGTKKNLEGFYLLYSLQLLLTSYHTLRALGLLRSLAHHQAHALRTRLGRHRASPKLLSQLLAEICAGLVNVGREAGSRALDLLELGID